MRTRIGRFSMFPCSSISLLSPNHSQIEDIELTILQFINSKFRHSNWQKLTRQCAVFFRLLHVSFPFPKTHTSPLGFLTFELPSFPLSKGQRCHQCTVCVSLSAGAHVCAYECGARLYVCVCVRVSVSVRARLSVCECVCVCNESKG